MLGIVQQVAVFVLPILLILTFLTSFHEFGHFVVARLFGVKVDRFSVGFGRAVASYTTKSGMEWRLGWIPVGGYVKFAGDADVASRAPDSEDLAELRRGIVATRGHGAVSQYFHFKPVWQRALIVAAGPVANFVLAVLIFTVLALAIGTPRTEPRIGAVVPGSPALKAGFRPGDLIVAVDGKPLRAFEDLAAYVSVRAGEPVGFDVQRGGRALHLQVTPARKTVIDPYTKVAQQIGQIGLAPAARPVHVHNNLGEAFRSGAHMTASILGGTVHVVGKIFTGQESLRQISGPIGMAHLSGSVTNAATQGPAQLADKVENTVFTMISLAGFLSVGIGFANLLPIPVLDGGHLLFYAYEAVARRPLGARVQEAGFRIGLALLAGLMLFATWNDLQKLSVFKNLGGLFS